MKKIIIILIGAVILGGIFVIYLSKETKNEPVGESYEETFLGDQGEKVGLTDGEILLATSVFDDNRAHFYNVEMPDGKKIYFFIVKDKNNIYRAAANGCQVCFSEKKGFYQEGDDMVCANCGNRYPIEKIATEKGGCNPGPINPDLEVRNGEIVIKQTDLEKVAEFF